MKLRNFVPMPKPSIYELKGKTIVAFGSGSIQMGVATDDYGQVMVFLSDVMHENPIGLDTDFWEDAKGETVVLGFNKVESLDALIKTLEEAKAYLLEAK